MYDVLTDDDEFMWIHGNKLREKSFNKKQTFSFSLGTSYALTNSWSSSLCHYDK